MGTAQISKIIFADNKKALFDYEVIEEYEAGIKLYGEEVKSIRNGSINLKGSYILINQLQIYATGIHIGEYQGGSRIIAPKRNRDILLKKSEIIRLSIKIKDIGGTLIPLQIYSKGNLIKVRVALVKGKKTWQKKETLKNRDLDREMQRAFKI